MLINTIFSSTEKVLLFLRLFYVIVFYVSYKVNTYWPFIEFIIFEMIKV